MNKEIILEHFDLNVSAGCHQQLSPAEDDLQIKNTGLVVSRSNVVAAMRKLTNVLYYST